MFFESIALNAAIIIVLIIALSLDYITKFFSYWYVRHIPYKKPIPGFGSDLQRVLGVADAADVAADIYSRYPNEKYVGYIKSRIPELIVRDPEIIKLIINDDSSYFRDRGLCLANSADCSTRNNLFHAESELWSALRARMQGFFDSEAAWRRMSACAQRGFPDVLPATAQECDVRELARDVTSRLLYECVFGEDVLSEADKTTIGQILEKVQSRSYVSRFKSYLMSVFPSLYVLFGLTKIDGTLLQSLKATISRASTSLKEGTLLEYLLEQKEAGPMDVTPTRKGVRKTKGRWKEFDGEVVAAQVVSVIAEGLAPCSAAVASALYELSRRPELLAQVKREADVEGGALTRVVDEVLRLYPAYPVLSRLCVATYKIPDTDVVIDRGVTVTVPVAALHRDPAHYARPDAFDPGRFDPEESQKRHAYAYLPFGAGPRSCIGSRLAKCWVRACVAGVLRAHTVSPCPRTPAALRPARTAFTAVLDRPLWLSITPAVEQ